MTEFYNTGGKYWPGSEIVSGGGDCLQVIAIEHNDDIEFVDDEDEGLHLFEEEDDDVVQLIEEESSSAESMVIEIEEEEEEDHSFPTARLFTDELELLLTNVDGDDSDPELTIIPGPSAQADRRRGRRVYRKSMSLPMSPVGGARQRLDSFNFSEFLLSPLKMSLDVDPVTHFEDISVRSDFNLINFVGTDAEKEKEKNSSSPMKNSQKEEKLKIKPDPVPMAAPPPPKPAAAAAPKPQPQSLSKGKCLDLLRATHERQENLVKRCVAIDQNKRTVTKNLFPGKPNGSSTSKKTFGRSISRKSSSDAASLKNDPNWSPTREEINPPKRGNNNKSKEQKTNSQGGGRSSVVSGNSNLNDIKRRFLANIPSVVAPSAAVKRKLGAPKVIRTDVPILPLDHNYCSPVKRSLPVAKNVKINKSTILIEQTPVVVKKEKVTPKKIPSITKAPPPQVRAPALVVTVKKEPEVVIEKKRTLNLEDYKKLRSEGNSNSVKTKPPTVPTGYVDPISEAKEKALRMQERRKAARLKQEELKLNTIPLVPILPLAVMTGLISEEGYKAELNGAKNKKNKNSSQLDDDQRDPSFDEIMIVSVGCNTQVTIRPDFKSSALLTNLSCNARNQITSNSLLFSMMDAVTKKTIPQSGQSPDTAQFSPGKPEGANEGDAAIATATEHQQHHHHGEDKVIMHLRKDRIRPKVFNASCQTEVTAEFPELLRLTPPVNKRNFRRRSTSRSSSRGSSRSSSVSSYSGSESESRSSSVSRDSCSAASEDEYGRSAKRRRLYSNRSWSRSRSRDRQSASRFRSRSPRRSWDRDSRSRSRSRSTSRPAAPRVNRNNNNSNRWRNTNQSPEERKIVYVGRLEMELGKDELRQKFSSYGAIRMVTIHEKANGTRYGFVTFEEPSDAFKAIESAKENPLVNKYDIGFGGRRAFCGQSYADLDNVATEEDMYGAPPVTTSSFGQEESFESLLQSFKRKVQATAP